MFNETAGLREPEQSDFDDEAAEGIIPVDAVIDTESAELPEEVKQQVTDKGLDVLRESLRNVDGYVVFASTAKYLHGAAKGIEELHKAPGDFDLAVFDNHKLDEIRDRFLEHADVEFLNVEPTEKEQHDKKKFLTKDDVNAGRKVVFKPFPGEQTLALKGKLIVEVDTDIGKRKFSIPFEVFARTNVVDGRLKQYEETVGGLRTLSLEGLEKQYLTSLEKSHAWQKTVKSYEHFWTRNRHATLWMPS